jgi:hypothetical protein
MAREQGETMSKVTQKEMLGLLAKRRKELVDILAQANCPRAEDELDTIDAIRVLIEKAEHGPEVSREFVHQWADRIIELLKYGYFNLLQTMLREAGVRVKEAADE